MTCGECKIECFTVPDAAPIEADGRLGYCELTRRNHRSGDECDLDR